MMSWFRTDAALFRHPKVFKLDKALEQERSGWYLVGLWSWLVTYASRGRFAAELASDVERECGWRGEPGKLVAGFITVGLLDEVGGGDLAAHDWDEKQGALFEKAEKDAARKRKQRERDRRRDSPRDVQRDVTRDGAGTVRTGRDGTRRDVTEYVRASAEPQSLPVTILAPTSPASSWVADDFWRWAQARRIAAGFVAEKHPGQRLTGWYSAVLLTLNGDVDRLQEAFYAFGDDAYWQKPKQPPPLPFAGFMSQWERYVPRGSDAA